MTVGSTNYVINAVTGETLGIGTDTVTFAVKWDTVKVQDPYQSWFVVFVNINGGEIWGTRNALRLSQEPNWVCIARGVGGNGFSSKDFAFSRDLEHFFIAEVQMGYGELMVLVVVTQAIPYLMKRYHMILLLVFH